MTNTKPLTKDFPKEVPPLSEIVEKIAADFDRAVAHLYANEPNLLKNSDPLSDQIGLKTYIYIHQTNMDHIGGNTLTHREAIQTKDYNNNLLAVLDPEIPFDEQWPEDMRNCDNITTLALFHVIAPTVREFTTPEPFDDISLQEPSLLTVARRHIAAKLGW